MWILSELGSQLLGFVMYFFAPDGFFFPLYILTSLFLGLVVSLVRGVRVVGESVGSLMLSIVKSNLFNKDSRVLVDYRYVFIVQPLFYFLFTFTILGSFDIGIDQRVEGALRNTFGPPPALRLGVFLTAMMTGVFFALNSFLGFVHHYFYHKIPFLWEFHKVHHSSEVLTFVVSGKVHPVEVLTDVTLNGTIAAIFLGVIHYFFGNEFKFFTIFHVNIFVALKNLFGAPLTHSGVWWNYPRWLSCILISPASHQIHHSKEERHWDKNFGCGFAIWDYLAGTLYVPDDNEKFSLGLANDEQKEFNGALKHFYLPFQKAFGPLSAFIRRRLV